MRLQKYFMQEQKKSITSFLQMEEEFCLWSRKAPTLNKRYQSHMK